MKIGQLVRHFLPLIVKFCEHKNNDEILRLQDIIYSKQTFDINFPFWTEKDDIEESKRYWSDIYQINGKMYRASSQWFTYNKELFVKYLIVNNIATKEELDELDIETEKKIKQKIVRKIKNNSRFKSATIGNAQNAVVRNILSNIGEETFSEENWKEAKDFFDNKCAYCGSSEERLEMDHSVPINKNMLGEHRLGNLIPSCHACNRKKGTLNYTQFLKDDQLKINKIKEYMDNKKYTPLIDSSKSEIIAQLLEKAYLETADVAAKYIEIIELITSEKEH